MDSTRQSENNGIEHHIEGVGKFLFIYETVNRDSDV